MDRKRLIQWLIPFLFGMGIGILILWNVDLWLPHDAIARTAAELFGTAALLVAVLVQVRTGYKWPWEGGAEWFDRQVAAVGFRRYMLWLIVWIIIVLLLIALFTFLQPHG
jgi:glucose-6-phosphate-specific signal transduction histidine kinase